MIETPTETTKMMDGEVEQGMRCANCRNRLQKATKLSPHSRCPSNGPFGQEIKTSLGPVRIKTREVSGVSQSSRIKARGLVPTAIEAIVGIMQFKEKDCARECLSGKSLTMENRGAELGERGIDGERARGLLKENTPMGIDGGHL